MDMNELSFQSLPLSLTTASPEETEAVGAALGRLIDTDATVPPYIAMFGDLGVGKTAFVRGLASVLAPGRAVRSPTFSLVHEYSTPGKRPLFHFDLYRIDSEDDLYSIGYDDYPDAGICVCEWCEKIPYALPARRLEVRISKTDAGTDMRKIDIILLPLLSNQKEAPAC